MRKQNRNAGFTQLELPGISALVDPATQAMAMAFAADAEPGETEPLAPGTWIPPTPTLRDIIPGNVTVYSLFDWWFASVETRDPHMGWWAYLYEWLPNQERWAFITKLHDERISGAFSKARAAARRLLIEGQRPEAMGKNEQLRTQAEFWREHGHKAQSATYA